MGSARGRFVRQPDVGDQRFFKRPVPPPSYTDGIVTIRPLEPDADLERDLEAKDAEQQRWLWMPDERSTWSAMTPDQQRAHALSSLRERADRFATGPRFGFAVDTAAERYVAYLDLDLGGTHHARTDPGDANVSYSAHPSHRRQGLVTRAVRLGFDFLRDHTAVRRAHIQVDPANTPSLRVAGAVGAVEYERSDLVRHAIDL